MKESGLFRKVLAFILILVLVTVTKQVTITYLIELDITSYKTLLIVKTLFNILLTFFSYFMIISNSLEKEAGLSKIKPHKVYLVVFGAAYLIGLNILFSDDIHTNSFVNILVLLIYCISIGYAEELSIRGFVQSSLVKYFNKPHTAIIIASLVFGLLHLIRFDKGIYGELSQVVFATFIGIMFGALLLITKRIYPLIIAHALIDFFAKIDHVGLDFSIQQSTQSSPTNALLTVLLVAPCFIYGMYLIKKQIKPPLVN
ncbi:CPBP family intramembrane metalloprotease [Tenacibaculum sp. 190130A14a]|uniref:CPBP family intramembrane metalloprotease n=1 Tax=Tenacibaculum polynesiense TaxID=3137857 RepID=A0ABP1F2L6_9FLAO